MFSTTEGGVTNAPCLCDICSHKVTSSPDPVVCYQGNRRWPNISVTWGRCLSLVTHPVLEAETPLQSQKRNLRELKREFTGGEVREAGSHRFFVVVVVADSTWQVWDLFIYLCNELDVWFINRSHHHLHHHQPQQQHEEDHWQTLVVLLSARLPAVLGRRHKERCEEDWEWHRWGCLWSHYSFYLLCTSKQAFKGYIMKLCSLYEVA